MTHFTAVLSVLQGAEARRRCRFASHDQLNIGRGALDFVDPAELGIVMVENRNDILPLVY